MIDYTYYAAVQKIRHEKASKAELFRLLCLQYVDLPYIGGQENPLHGTDCSGLVCGPLHMMGYDIRTTADSLYHHIFTDKLTNAHEYADTTKIIAVFYITNDKRKHFGRTVKSGYVTHVAPVVGQYVLLNAWEPTIKLMTSAAVYAYYNARNFKVEWRALDWDALELHSEKKTLMSGVDDVLSKLREA